MGNDKGLGPWLLPIAAARLVLVQIISPFARKDFAVFAKLRDPRKEIAQAEAFPVYTVFTNEEPARMVQSKARTNPP